MKRIEDIENISLEALEKISENAATEVPSSLKDNVRNSLVANDVLEQESHRPRAGVFTLCSLAIASVAALALFLVLNGQPEDTFRDPYIAYAELEKTLSYISSKVENGCEIAEAAGPLIEKTVNYSEKIIIK